jgi:hypothetical protein
MDAKRGISEKSADTLVIEHRLRTTESGDIVTYDELSKLLGRDVKLHCRSGLRTARNALVYEAIHFATIPGEGFKRLTADESVSSSQSHINRARAASRKGLKQLQHVKADELSGQMKQTHLAKVSQLGMLHLFSTASAAKKIEAKVQDSNQQIPIGETLKLFGG